MNTWKWNSLYITFQNITNPGEKQNNTIIIRIPCIHPLNISRLQECLSPKPVSWKTWESSPGTFLQQSSLFDYYSETTKQRNNYQVI